MFRTYSRRKKVFVPVFDPSLKMPLVSFVKESHHLLFSSLSPLHANNSSNRFHHVCFVYLTLRWFRDQKLTHRAEISRPLWLRRKKQDDKMNIQIKTYISLDFRWSGKRRRLATSILAHGKQKQKSETGFEGKNLQLPTFRFWCGLKKHERSDVTSRIWSFTLGYWQVCFTSPSHLSCK